MPADRTLNGADSARPLPPQGYLLLAGLTLFWGANWPVMKIALEEIPVWWFRAACLVIGGAGLMAIARLSGSAIRLPRSEIGPLLACALFGMVGWHLFSGYGVALMPAGRAAIIAFTMPVWASLFGSIVLGEPFTRTKVAGLALGMAGLAVLIGPDLVALQSAPVGALFMLGAALSWALGTVLFKRFDWTPAVISLAGWQLLVSAVPVTAGALLLQEPPDLTQLSGEAIVAMAYVFALPMIFCQWAFLKTVKLFPASIAAIGTLAIPVVGVYASAMLLGEPVGWRELTALAFTCSALSVVLVMPAIRAPAGT